jgi:hypothetical protein
MVSSYGVARSRATSPSYSDSEIECLEIWLCTLVVRNANLHRDLRIEMVTAEARRFARKHEERLLNHDNVEAVQLLDHGELTRRLRRTKPFELV